MTPFYRQFSGQNLARLGALSDGIFAVAMKLLVLNISVPAVTLLRSQQPLWAGGSWQSEGRLLSTLAPLAPQLLTYFMSFLTLGIFWAVESLLTIREVSPCFAGRLRHR